MTSTIPQKDEKYIVSCIKDIDLRINVNDKSFDEILDYIFNFLSLLDIDFRREDLFSLIEKHKEILNNVYYPLKMARVSKGTRKKKQNEQCEKQAEFWSVNTSPRVHGNLKQKKYDRITRENLKFPNRVDQKKIQCVPLDIEFVHDNIALTKTIKFVNLRIAETLKANIYAKTATMQVDVAISGKNTWDHICRLFSSDPSYEAKISYSENKGIMVINWDLDNSKNSCRHNPKKFAVPPNIEMVRKNVMLYRTLNFVELRIVEQLSQNIYSKSVSILIDTGLSTIQTWQQVCKIFNKDVQYECEIATVKNSEGIDITVLMIEWDTKNK